MKYLAIVERADGSVNKVRVSTNDVTAVAKQLRVRPASIRSIKPDYFDAVKGIIDRKGLSIDEQAVMLDQIAALLNTKRSPSQIINGILKKEKSTFVDNELFAKAQTIPQFLEAMRFNQNAILLARAGDESGDLKGALRAASKSLFEMAEMRGAVIQRVKGGLIYLILGIGMAILGPYFYGGQLEEIEASMGRTLTHNFFTEYLFFVRGFLIEYWWTIPSALILLYLVRSSIWVKVRRFGPFRIINDLRATARSVNFLLGFSIMLESGKPNREALTIIRENASKADKPVYDSMIMSVNQGTSLGRTFNEDEWPATLVTAMNGFDEMAPKDKLELAESIQRSLKLQLQKLADVLAQRTKFIGTIALATSLVFCIIGFMLPLASVSTGS